MYLNKILEHTNSIEIDYSLEYINNKVDKYIQEIELSDGFIGQEKYNILIRPFTGLLNLIHGSIKTITMETARINKVIARSELRVYHDRHPLNIMKIFAMPYVDILDLKIPIPMGMKSDYITTVTNIENFYGSVGISLLEKFDNSIRDIFNNMISSNLPPDGILNTINATLSSVFTVKDSLFMTHTKDFVKDDKSLEVPFRTKFKNSKDLRVTNQLLLSMQKELINIGQVTKRTNNISDNCNKIIKFIEGSENKTSLITANFINGLAILTRGIAETIDMYVSIMDAHIAIEHNFVKTLDRIYTVS